MVAGKTIAVLLLALMLGGCKMFLVKSAVRLAAGPQAAEQLDPYAQLRRAVFGQAQGAATGAAPNAARTAAPSGPATPP